jgi:hypothetical protein
MKWVHACKKKYYIKIKNRGKKHSGCGLVVTLVQTGSNWVWSLCGLNMLKWQWFCLNVVIHLYITLFYKTTAVKNSNVHIDKRFFQQSVCNYGKIIYIQPFSASKMLFA